MNQTWVLLWLAGEPATAAQHQALDAWAESAKVTLIAPSEQAAAPYPGATVAHIEDLLERARVATDALDAARAQELIAQAQQLLFAHPELPQAAWLLAETYSIAADLASSSGSASSDDTGPRSAHILEGARAPSVSQHPDAPPPTPAPEASFRERIVSGMSPGDELVWNGVAVPSVNSLPNPWRVESPAGIHHVQVRRGARQVWSGWVELDEHGATVALPVPKAAPCSRDDLEPLRSAAWNELTVACERWVAARPAPASEGASTGGIEVAWCHRNQCGSFHRWPPPRPVPRGALADVPQKTDDGTTWWAYALLGTSATATAAILLLSLTQRSHDKRPAWIYGGVR